MNYAALLIIISPRSSKCHYYTVSSCSPICHFAPPEASICRPKAARARRAKYQANASNLSFRHISKFVISSKRVKRARREISLIIFQASSTTKGISRFRFATLKMTAGYQQKTIRLREILRFALNDTLGLPVRFPFVLSSCATIMSFRPNERSECVEKSPALYHKPNQRPRGFLDSVRFAHFTRNDSGI